MSSFSHGVAQFNAVAVGHPQHGGFGQEVAGPALPGPQSAVEPGTAGQVGERAAIVVPEPVVESQLADVLHGLQHTDGDQFAQGEDGLAMAGNIGQGDVDLAEQFGDKIGNVLGVPRC